MGGRLSKPKPGSKKEFKQMKQRYEKAELKRVDKIVNRQVVLMAMEINLSWRIVLGDSPPAGWYTAVYTIYMMYMI